MKKEFIDVKKYDEKCGFTWNQLDEVLKEKGYVETGSVGKEITEQFIFNDVYYKLYQDDDLVDTVSIVTVYEKESYKYTEDERDEVFNNDDKYFIDYEKDEVHKIVKTYLDRV